MNTKASSTTPQDATSTPAPKAAGKGATTATTATTATKVAKAAKADKPIKPAPSPTPAPKAEKAPKAAKPAKPVAAKKATASAPPAAAPAAPAPASAAADAAQGKPGKKALKPRPVLVRDSFTMPEDDFALILKLKATALGQGRAAKKSELLRAGLRLLSGMDAESLVVALDRLETVKTGRPKKGH